MENKDVTASVEFLVDNKNITISQERYEELIRAETERNILRHAYHTQESYNYNCVFEVMFGKKPKVGE